MKLLVIGGYGSFGARLVKRLKDESGLEIYIAGRSVNKAASFCMDVTGQARLHPLALDKNQDLEPQLSFVPDIMIDAAGPFQNTKSGKDNPVMAYALKHGLIYFDLSDDREFIGETLILEKDAKRSGAVLISGLSTYPTLTAAVVEDIERRHGRVTSV